MSAKERAKRDEEMAKRLRTDAYHNAKAVAKRKARTFNDRINKLRSGGTYR